MPRQLIFVQFPHNGNEHSVSNWRYLKKGINPVFKQWNTGDHRRKFMHLKGDYVDNAQLKTSDEIYCWGEWEPDSFVELTNNPQADGITLPEYVHTPFLTPSFLSQYNVSNLPKSILVHAMNHQTNGICSNSCVNSCSGLQNTDPYIFFDGFLFSCCHQRTKRGATRLQNLASGSIILFGSSIGIKTSSPYFVVDTVFVVDKSHPFIIKSASSDLKGFVPDYYPVGIMQYGDPNDSNAFTCYRGKSYSGDFNVPFSFVPCKEGAHNKTGFKRPIIDLQKLPANLVNPKSAQAFKTTYISQNESVTIWKSLRDMIVKQGFQLGVKF